MMAVRQAMDAEGMTHNEVDRVMRTVITQEINTKVEQLQNRLLQERDRFLEPSLPDQIAVDALEIDFSRNARNGK